MIHFFTGGNGGLTLLLDLLRESDGVLDYLTANLSALATTDGSQEAVKGTSLTTKLDMDRLWRLFGMGGATSAGYDQRREGSECVFAYGQGDGTGKTLPAVDITSWNGEKRTQCPATKENVAQAFREMKITDTVWQL